MVATSSPRDLHNAMEVLSILMLSREPAADLIKGPGNVQHLDERQFASMVALAHSNHVIVRALETFRVLMLSSGDHLRAGWADAAIKPERARIEKAIQSLRTIIDAFHDEGLDVTVMKSLDHWPDFGSDIDLYTNASTEAVANVMSRRFHAELASQSWGDRLASKWNFNIPGLTEAVEVHSGRLGQTGEQLVLSSTLPARARVLHFAGQAFPVPSPSDRVMISVLQRMYRHFYFRLCDITDSAELASSGVLDYEELRTSARAANIWEGVATYLVLVSDYVQKYRNEPLELPGFVRDTARFNGQVMHLRGPFLRVPLVPHSVGLYRLQLRGLLSRRDLKSSARLALLPWLATAAAIGYKISGSDKGIW